MASDAQSGIERAEVNAAFGLAPSAPAAGALVLAGLYPAGAWQAADGGEALGDQRMTREAGFGDVVQHVACAPADERIDLYPLALGLEQRQARPRRALEALAALDPRVVALNRLGERSDLANLATPVRVAGEEKLLRVLARDRLGARLNRGDIGQAKRLAKHVAIGERFREMLAGVDENDRRRRVDARDHVQERGGVGAEARDQGDPAGIEVLDREPQQRGRLEAREPALQPGRGDLVAEQLDVMRAHQMSDPALRS